MGQILDTEMLVRLGAFLGVFATMAIWEAAAPRRTLAIGRRARWPGNLGLVVIDAALLRLIHPATAVGAAVFAETHGWGLFNAWPVSGAVAIAASVVVLDLAIYVQHVLFHAVPVLWRLHRVHHADLDFDVTTGTRFHPVEIVLSLGIKMAVVMLLGAPAAAVLVFEVLLNATSMFNHGNVRMPIAADRLLRLVVVTPDMHRVHHSIRPEETNSNFGFSLPWWDWVFGTYRDQPRAGHERMTIGIEQFRDPRELRLDRLLIQPALGEAAGYPINRAGGTK
jgi:sterol desaturase/sphingolipid hydroxylase (fatty acid hydroxylase superfamily)